MERKPALCLVHMESQRELLAYKYGSVSKGFMKMRYVIDSANKLGVPIIFLTLDDYWPLPNELTESVRNYQKVRIPHQNGFNEYLAPVPLQNVLKTFSVTDLAIGGYNKFVCVRDTAVGAVLEGFHVHITDEILFSNLDNIDNEEVLAEFRMIGTVYDTAEELVREVFENLQNHSSSK